MWVGWLDDEVLVGAADELAERRHVSHRDEMAIFVAGVGPIVVDSLVAANGESEDRPPDAGRKGTLILVLKLPKRFVVTSAERTDS